jgi:hypothetical protein
MSAEGPLGLASGQFMTTLNPSASTGGRVAALDVRGLGDRLLAAIA